MKPASLSARILSIFLSFVFFISNSALANVPEANFWSQRRTEIESNKQSSPDPIQLAALPASAWSNPAQILKQLPSPQSSQLNSSIATQLKKTSVNGAANKLGQLASSLPFLFGNVREISIPQNGKVDKIVIHVQDVHQNLEAQKNIGSAIQELIDRNEVGLVALEGAFTPIELENIRRFPDKPLLTQIAEFLLKQNKISGPIASAISNSNGPLPPFVGVDHPVHYKANLDAYKNSVGLQKKYQEQLSILEKGAEQKKRSMFNQPLLAFDSQVRAYHQNKIQLGAYLNFLSKYSHSTDLNVETFLMAYSMESQLKFGRVEAERSQLIKKLIEKLNQEQIQNLAREGIAYRLGQISHTTFYSTLRDLCEKHDIRLVEFPAMDAYVQYVLLSDNIKAEDLFNATAKMEQEGYKQMAATSEEQELVIQSNLLLLVGKLLEFSLTPDEWSEYKVSAGNAVLASIGDLKTFENFYREAEARNDAITTNLLNEMDKVNAKVAVLVTGGFHSPGINENLRKKKVSSIDFVPKITKIDSDGGSSYLSAFTQAKTPLEKLFEGEKLFIAKNPASPAAWAEVGFLAAARAKLSVPNSARAKFVSLLSRWNLENHKKGKNGESDILDISRQLKEEKVTATIVVPNNADGSLADPEVANVVRSPIGSNGRKINLNGRYSQLREELQHALGVLLVVVVDLVLFRDVRIKINWQATFDNWRKTILQGRAGAALILVNPKSENGKFNELDPRLVAVTAFGSMGWALPAFFFMSFYVWSMILTVSVVSLIMGMILIKPDGWTSQNQTPAQIYFRRVLARTFSHLNAVGAAGVYILLNSFDPAGVSWPIMLLIAFEVFSVIRMAGLHIEKANQAGHDANRLVSWGRRLLKLLDVGGLVLNPNGVNQVRSSEGGTPRNGGEARSITLEDVGVLFGSGFYGSLNRLARQQFIDDDFGRAQLQGEVSRAVLSKEVVRNADVREKVRALYTQTLRQAGISESDLDGLTVPISDYQNALINFKVALERPLVEEGAPAGYEEKALLVKSRLLEALMTPQARGQFIMDEWEYILIGGESFLASLEFTEASINSTNITGYITDVTVFWDTVDPHPAIDKLMKDDRLLQFRMQGKEDDYVRETVQNAIGVIQAGRYRRGNALQHIFIQEEKQKEVTVYSVAGGFSVFYVDRSVKPAKSQELRDANFLDGARNPSLALSLGQALRAAGVLTEYYLEQLELLENDSTEALATTDVPGEEINLLDQLQPGSNAAKYVLENISSKVDVMLALAKDNRGSVIPKDTFIAQRLTLRPIEFSYGSPLDYLVGSEGLRAANQLLEWVLYGDDDTHISDPTDVMKRLNFSLSYLRTAQSDGGTEVKSPVDQSDWLGGVWRWFVSLVWPSQGQSEGSTEGEKNTSIELDTRETSFRSTVNSSESIQESADGMVNETGLGIAEADGLPGLPGFSKQPLQKADSALSIWEVLSAVSKELNGNKIEPMANELARGVVDAFERTLRDKNRKRYESDPGVYPAVTAVNELAEILGALAYLSTGKALPSFWDYRKVPLSSEDPDMVLLRNFIAGYRIGLFQDRDKYFNTRTINRDTIGSNVIFESIKDKERLAQFFIAVISDSNEKKQIEGEIAQRILGISFQNHWVFNIRNGLGDNFVPREIFLILEDIILDSARETQEAKERQIAMRVLGLLLIDEDSVKDLVSAGLLDRAENLLGILSTEGAKLNTDNKNNYFINRHAQEAKTLMDDAKASSYRLWESELKKDRSLGRLPDLLSWLRNIPSVDLRKEQTLNAVFSKLNKTIISSVNIGTAENLDKDLTEIFKLILEILVGDDATFDMTVKNGEIVLGGEKVSLFVSKKVVKYKGQYEGDYAYDVQQIANGFQQAPKEVTRAVTAFVHSITPDAIISDAEAPLTDFSTRWFFSTKLGEGILSWIGAKTPGQREALIRLAAPLNPFEIITLSIPFLPILTHQDRWGWTRGRTVGHILILMATLVLPALIIVDPAQNWGAFIGLALMGNVLMHFIYQVDGLGGFFSGSAPLTSGHKDIRNTLVNGRGITMSRGKVVTYIAGSTRGGQVGKLTFKKFEISDAVLTAEGQAVIEEKIKQDRASGNNQLILLTKEQIIKEILIDQNKFGDNVPAILDLTNEEMAKIANVWPGYLLEARQGLEGFDRVRISMAGLVSFRTADRRYLLMRKRKTEQKDGQAQIKYGSYLPFGGAHHHAGLTQIFLEGLGAADFEGEHDLRFTLPTGQLAPFEKWFDERFGRETDPIRELFEEMVEENPFLTAQEFNSLITSQGQAAVEALPTEKLQEKGDLDLGEAEAFVVQALQVAEEMADQIGRFLAGFREIAKETTKQKADQSAVSGADVDSMDMSLQMVVPRFPGHFMQGEEKSTDEKLVAMNEQRKGSDWKWVVDPLDGSGAYLKGTGTFADEYAYQIVLTYKGMPVVAVVFMPEKKAPDGKTGVMLSMRLGRDGVYMNGKKLDAKASQKTFDKISDFTVVAHESQSTGRLYPHKQKLAAAGAKVIDRLGSIGARISGVVLNMAGVHVEGISDADIVATYITFPWDYMAPAALLWKAGGTVQSHESGKSVFDPLLIKGENGDTVDQVPLLAGRSAEAVKAVRTAIGTSNTANETEILANNLVDLAQALALRRSAERTSASIESIINRTDLSLQLREYRLRGAASGDGINPINIQPLIRAVEDLVASKTREGSLNEYEVQGVLIQLGILGVTANLPDNIINGEKEFSFAVDTSDIPWLKTLRFTFPKMKLALVIHNDDEEKFKTELGVTDNDPLTRLWSQNNKLFETTNDSVNGHVARVLNLASFEAGLAQGIERSSLSIGNIAVGFQDGVSFNAEGLAENNLLDQVEKIVLDSMLQGAQMQLKLNDFVELARKLAIQA